MKGLGGWIFLLFAGTGMMAEEFWIWAPGDHALSGVPAGQVRFFRRTFGLEALPVRAEVKITADDRYTLFVNGREIGSDENWYLAETYDVQAHLRVGRNVIAVQAENNQAGPAGLRVQVMVQTGTGEPRRFDSDRTWRASSEAGAGWTEADYDDSGWATAEELAPPFGGPWGGGTNELPKPLEVLQAEQLAAYRQLMRTQFHQRGRNVVPRPHSCSLPRPGGPGKDSLVLAQNGQPQVSLVACSIDRQEVFAAQLFQAAVEELSGAKLELLDAAVTPFGPGQVWIIRAGCGALPRLARQQAARTQKLSPEGYTLGWHDFSPSSQAPAIFAIGHEDPGVVYQVHTLAQLLAVEGKTVRLPLLTLADWPDAPVRGIVGGAGVEDLPWLSFYKYNAVVYGLNPLQPLAPDLIELTDYARQWGIELVGFWHLPYDFPYADPATLETLAQRLREAATLGFRAFSINADDFPNETIADADRARFGPGLEGLFKAQQAMLQYLHKAVQGDLTLWFCPRVYYDVRHAHWEPAPPDPATVAYRVGLGNLPEDIILWTTQPKLDYLRETNHLWRRKPMIWHNYLLDFSQCQVHYFAAYPAVPREVVRLSAGLWMEGDQFQGRTRASYVTHAAALWNVAAPVSLGDALAREYGATAGAALADYVKTLQGGSEPRGKLVDHWDQPNDFPAKLFGTNGAGLLPHLPPGSATARELRKRAEAAAQARAIDLAGVPPDVAEALRTDAEKIELNFRAFAVWAELRGTPVSESRRRDLTEEWNRAILRLQELGVETGYLRRLSGA